MIKCLICKTETPFEKWIKDDIVDPYRPQRLSLRRSIIRICPKCGYLVDLSILADFQGFDLFTELDKQFSEWNSNGKKKS